MKLNNSQRFAIDRKRANDNGEFFTGDRTTNESYLDYGSPIYPMTDGTANSTLDNIGANPPGILPASDPVRTTKLTPPTPAIPAHEWSFAGGGRRGPQVPCTLDNFAYQGQVNAQAS